MSAVKAVSAGQLAMASSGIFSVNFDEALEAMRQTAQDMNSKYKETSLAVRSLFAFLII
jgi:L-serine dehydratase